MATRVMKHVHVALEFDFEIEDITEAVVNRYIKQETEGFGLERPVTSDDIVHQSTLLEDVLKSPDTVDALMVEELSFFADSEFQSLLIQKCAERMGARAGVVIFRDILAPHFAAMNGDARKYFDQMLEEHPITDATNLFSEAIHLELKNFTLRTIE